MADVVKHAPQTHRMKDEGGSDPVPYCLPYIRASNNGATQAVTGNEELQFSTANGLVLSNDSTTFRFDTADPGGILVIREGVYRAYATVYYNGADLSDAREMYATAQALSGGPLAGVGAAFGDGGGWFLLGPGQAQASISQVTATNTIPKSVLSFIAMGLISPSPTDPIRVAVILQHLGSDYTLSSSPSSLVVERVGTAGMRAKAPVT